MRIKSLEIIGFKSFYERTSIHFQNVINAAVGPNGCGKSNILDAIRWVLGEQNPRRLRAGGMEEVISNGGEALKPLGMAEVSLSIVDVAEKGFEEVVIRRRLFRSGESEYYINGTPCRLKDLTEMFMDTGAGARSYSVIDQGKIEHLVTAKPEENRALIEEVAGIVKYKARRRETESHIESTKENLRRVKDVINEVNRQMSALSRQAKDADEFKRLSEEARRIELKIFHLKLYETRRKVEKFLNEKSRLEEEIFSIENAIVEKESALKLRESEALRLDQKVEQLGKGIYETKSELQAKEAMRETLQSEVSRLDEFIERLEGEIRLLKEEDEKTEIQTGLKEEALEEVKTDLSLKELQLRQKETAISEFKSGLGESQSELDAIRKALFESLDKYGSLKGSAFGCEKELNELKSRRERTKKEFEEVKGENEKLLSRLSELERVLTGVKERRSQIEETKRDIADSLAQLNASREWKKEEAASLSERFKEVNSKLSVLKQIEANYEWLPEGIRRFLVERKGNGILGVVADFVSVPKGYERALEAVFGEKLKWVLVKESEEAIRAVDSLRELSIGRGTFVPISSTRRNGTLEKNGKDVVPLWDMVTVEGNVKGVIRDMLNGVFVVSSLREALSLRGDVEEGASFVTLEGDLLDSTGAISGGFAGEGVFLRKREIEELTHEAQKLEKEMAEVSGELELNRVEIEKLENAVEGIRKELVEIEIKEAEIKKDASNLQDNLAKTQRRYEIIEFDLTGIGSEILEKEGELNETFATIERLENEKALLEKKFGELKERVQKREEDERNLQREVSNLQVEIATLTEKQKSFEEDLYELRERQKKTGEKIELETKEIERKKEEKLNLIKADEDNNETIRSILEVIVEKEKELSAGKNEKDELSYQIRTLHEEKEGLRKESVGLQERVNILKLELNTLHIETQHIENSIREFNLGDGLPDSNEISSTEDFENYDHDGEESRLKKIREKIEKLGPVNLLAPEEYKSLEERFKFLNEQMEDLVNAISSLRKAISKIDRESARRFNETFEVVNKKFQEVFRRLFRGGEAKLVLTDNEDLLETGVQIMVRPKGKKFQSVSLLSGGEKALSAIALVLSACLIKPAPFLLFDEIDAHLDDVNTVQFIDLLGEIAKESQVIIVTHNKKTMQVAGSLIGITSDKPGVSKVVSVELRGN